MKSEIYNALAAINRGFDAALESLTILQQDGILTAEYIQQQSEMAEEIRSGLNHAILEKLEEREKADWGHFGKMRVETGERLKKRRPGSVNEG
jgi:hypothetical protein